MDITSYERHFIDRKVKNRMEVNTADLMKYALGGAAFFIVIAIGIVVVFIKMGNRKEAKKDLKQKKKEEKKQSKRKNKELKKQQIKQEAELSVKESIEVPQITELPEETKAPQVVEAPVREPEVLRTQEDKEEPCYIAFYKVQSTGKDGNLAFCIREQLSIGRDKHMNDWVIEGDPTVSSKHCLIYRVGNGIYIQDFASTNGTYVNDECVMKPRRLENHDKVRIGHGEYRIKC